MNQAQQDEARSKLGVNIRRRREELGLSQEQLANRAEMGAAHLGNIERGSSRNNPTLKTLHKIASALETTLEKLFENTGGNPKDFDTEEKEPAWMKGSR